MIKRNITLILSLFLVMVINIPVFAQDDTFSNLGKTVGYIEDSNGNKYLVVEEGEGAKLIKIKEKPEYLLRENFGISKKDLKINGEE